MIEPEHDYDPSAPYNQAGDFSDLCRYCDQDVIWDQVQGSCFYDDFEDEMHATLQEATLCTNCLAEQKADLNRD